MRVRYNAAAEAVLANLDRSNASGAQSERRIASGLRVMTARDDATNFTLANNFNTDIISKSVALRNLSDGVNYCQAAQGALNTVQNMLVRAKGLAVQASNGSLSDAQRTLIDNEFQQIKATIDGIANSTETFGKHPLLGPTVAGFTDVFSSSGAQKTSTSGIIPLATIPKGAEGLDIQMDNFGMDDDIEIFTKDGKHLVGTDLTDAVWSANGVTASNVNSTLINPANGFDNGATYDDSNLNSGGPVYSPSPSNMSTYDGMNIGYGGDADRTDPNDIHHNNGNTGSDGGNDWEYMSIDKVSQDLLCFIVGQGAFGAQAFWTKMPATVSTGPEGDLQIMADSHYRGGDSIITVSKTASDTASLGIDASSLTTCEDATQAMDALDAALTTIGNYFGRYGSSANLLQAQYANIQNEIINQQSSKSIIQDADMAREVTNATKSRILSQAGSEMLAQAMAQPRSILSLLRQD